MKKIFFFIVFLFLNYSVAFWDTGSSNVIWRENSWKSECWTSFSHGVTHFWVPNFNSSTSNKNWSRACTTHTYSGKTYTKKISWSITSCDTGDRVVLDWANYNPNWWTVEICNEVEKKICKYTIRDWKCMRWRGGLRRRWVEMWFETQRGRECRQEKPKNRDFITCEKYDDTPPTLDDISIHFNNQNDINNLNWNLDTEWTFLRAENHSITFDIKKDDIHNSADLSRVQAKIENVDNSNNFDDKTRTSWFNWSNPTKNSYTENFNFQKVDNDKNSLNYRKFTYKLEDICDTAGNCLSHTSSGRNWKNINFNVYANYVSFAKTKITKPNLPWIADWSENIFKFNLRDKFGNNIIPVRNSKWNQIRDLAFQWYYSNNLFLNQYLWNWWSWIYSSNFYNWRLPILNPLNIWQNQTISKNFRDTNFSIWDYGINIVAYTPTYLSSATDWRQYVDWNTSLTNNFSVKLSDKPTSDFIPGTSVDLQFKPKVYTSITWDIIKDNLVVWAKQNSELNLHKNSNKNFTWNILLEYWKIDWTDKYEKHKRHDNFNLNFEKNWWISIISGFQRDINKLSNFWNLGKNLYTILYQKWKISEAEQKTYLATHIKEYFSWVWEAVYSSFVLWMDRYFWNLKSIENTYQRPLKIIWNTHSLYYSETVDGDQVKIIWDIEKSELQKFIRKSVNDDIRNISFSNTQKRGKSIVNLNNFSSSGWQKIWDTLYFLKEDWANVEISWRFSGIKNIVILWWNAYINWNITSSDKKSILSIISIENKWRWWNVYVNNKVTEIYSVIYADKSLLSTNNWVVILSPKNNWTYDLLKNQLYIYGSLFSNNTVWWSTSVNPICPYFIDNCTIDEAQKYDLYNFRRWYENLYKPLKEIYKDENLKDEYILNWKAKDVKYPMIIEYNPFIQVANLKFFQLKK